MRCQACPLDAEKQGAERIFKFCFELVECVQFVYIAINEKSLFIGLGKCERSEHSSHTDSQ